MQQLNAASDIDMHGSAWVEKLCSQIQSWWLPNRTVHCKMVETSIWHCLSWQHLLQRWRLLWRQTTPNTWSTHSLVSYWLNIWQGAFKYRTLHRGQRTKNTREQKKIPDFLCFDLFFHFQEGFVGREGFRNDPEPYGSVLIWARIEPCAPISNQILRCSSKSVWARSWDLDQVLHLDLDQVLGQVDLVHLTRFWTRDLDWSWSRTWSFHQGVCMRNVKVSKCSFSHNVLSYWLNISTRWFWSSATPRTTGENRRMAQDVYCEKPCTIMVSVVPRNIVLRGHLKNLGPNYWNVLFWKQLSAAEDFMPRDFVSSEPRPWKVFGQLVMTVLGSAVMKHGGHCATVVQPSTTQPRSTGQIPYSILSQWRNADKNQMNITNKKNSIISFLCMDRVAASYRQWAKLSNPIIGLITAFDWLHISSRHKASFTHSLKHIWHPTTEQFGLITGTYLLSVGCPSYRTCFQKYFFEGNPSEHHWFV